MNNRVYGWKKDKPDPRDHVFMPSPVGIEGLPPTIDFRPQQPPVYDQLALGSCTSQGLAGELEAQAMKQGETFVPLSRLFIYYNERDMEGTVSEDAGASIRDGIKSVATLGVCPESEWPYDISKFADKPPDACYADALKFKALQYQSVLQDLNHIKSAIAGGRGIVLGISVFSSFESEKTATTGIVPMPHLFDKFLGGHCVRLVGYTDVDLADIPAKHFIGMNSWGTGWGLKGFFAIPYKYILNHKYADDLWVINAVS